MQKTVKKKKRKVGKGYRHRAYVMLRSQARKKLKRMRAHARSL